MNIQTIASQYNVLYDRSLHTTLTLPYSGFANIKIAQNDLVTDAVINNALTKLYANYVQLYRYCNTASNIIPVSAIAFAGVTNNSNTLNWYTNIQTLSTSQFTPLSSAVYGLDNIEAIAGVLNTAITPNTYAFFTSNGTNLVVLTGDANFNNISVALSSTTTTTYSNIAFNYINKLVIDSSTNSLFVVDLSANTIHKFDASGFITYDTVLQNKLVYDKSIGGSGGYDDHNLFNQPRSLAVYNTNVYVLDSGNKCVKLYDTNFSWLETYRLFRDLETSYPIDMNIDSNGNVYILTDNNTIIQYNNSFTTKSITTLPDLTMNDEYYQNIIPSQTNSDIFYLVTNLNVYKKFFSAINDIIGNYLFYLYGVNTQEDIGSFASFSDASGNNDNNLVFSVSNNNTGKFGLYYDNINLIDILVSPSFDVYPLSAITVDRDEYVQNWVFNKAIAKLFINHVLLRDQMIGKFLYIPDANGNMVFQGIRYTTPAEQATITFGQDLNNFIGLNEIFQNNIINRTLEKIYNIQVALFNILLPDIEQAPNLNIPVYIN
jgi:hypothetical protein